MTAPGPIAQRSTHDHYASSLRYMSRMHSSSRPPRIIHNWRFDAETKGIKGQIYNYPGLDDGEPISTSPIVRVEGRTVYTYSRSQYQLGTIDPVFLHSLEVYDPDNPLSGTTF